MVGNNSRGNAETRYPFIEKYLYHCLCGSISDGDGFRPPSEMVNAGEKVRKTS